MNKAFVSNNYLYGRKVLTTIESELKKCRSFAMSVAFITSSGITPLLETFKELEERGVEGKILTSDYLLFSEPKALDKLENFKNIELKMYCCKEDEDGFHTKGYIFEREDDISVLVGSSNLTLSALTKNIEWNTSLSVDQSDEYAKNLLEEFKDLWNKENTLFYSLAKIDYKERYERFKRQVTNYEYADIAKAVLRPNIMQKQVVKNLENSVFKGDDRGLLISATGTGKTFASAFALKNLQPKKILFLVHREQIARQALDSYKRVFGNDGTFGLLSGSSKDYDANYLFSTMQTMSKDESLKRYDPGEFDVIVVDEVHRVGADSYKKIMAYFRPKYWFGMSASPERGDGFDIYTLFKHNILYEIRLKQALEEDLLCPFHYFGIRDIEIDGETFSDDVSEQFNRLTSDERVDYIIDKAKFFGYCGDRAKGLVFCRNKEEAYELSHKFNQRGYKTLALCGSDDQNKREEAIERLVSDERNDYLEYIFTIDIFNEGVDIPEINQVIMLRPTQSIVVFVQQLGRGLRKAKHKDYVVIIDFIGNYKNNFMIPMALSGDRTYNKDTIRRYLQEGNKVIPGSSTIHFDEISRKRIYEAIDEANFSDISLIKDSYTQLRQKLGHIPSLKEFDEHGSIDPLLIFASKTLGSYHELLKRYEKEYTIAFDGSKEDVLKFVSKKFANGKRPHELLALNYLLDHDENVFDYLEKELESKYEIKLDIKARENLINILTNEFLSKGEKKTFEDCVFIQKDQDDYRIAKNFKEMLKDEDFKKQLKETLNFGLYRNKSEYHERYDGTSFSLYAKYTYEEVCRLLNWSKNEVPLNIGGYKYDKGTNTYPIFINYDKDSDISDTQKYEDHLLSPDQLVAISKSGRTISSDDVSKALNSKKLGIEMDLFIRKNKDDKGSKEFYYMGKIYPTGVYKEFVMPNTNKTAVEINYMLKTPIKDDLYDYIING